MQALDQHFRVDVISQTPNPQTAIYAGLHQDYCEDYVFESRDKWPSETRCGEIAVDRLLSGGRGHYGPMEHAMIVFNVGYFPHCVMQQARTHRISTSFDVQSMRYSGKRLTDFWRLYKDQPAPVQLREVEKLIYFRPVGTYRDRNGKNYEYEEKWRQDDKVQAINAIKKYHYKMTALGYSEEHARSLLPFDFRQHFVVSFNLRSLMHFLSVRSKKDAQLEIRQLCDLMEPHFAGWCPEIYEWWATQWKTKGRLAP